MPTLDISDGEGHGIDLSRPSRDRIVRCALGLETVLFVGGVASGYALGSTASTSVHLGIVCTLIALVVALGLNSMVLIYAFALEE